MVVRYNPMGIPELLRGVQKERGYASVEDMAFQESMRLGERIPVATLRSWVSENPRYRRSPQSVSSLRTIEKITGLGLVELIEMVEQDAERMDTSRGKQEVA